MRVVFLTQWFDPEPGAVRGLPLARWLAARGHDVQVLTGVPNYPGGRVYPGYRMRLWQREVMDGVPVLRVPLYPSHDPSARGRVANYTSFALSAATLGAALVGRGDVAYVYHPPATVGLPAIVLKALRGIPFVYHIADMWPESVVDSGMLGNGALRRGVERLLSRWCHAVYRHSSTITVLSPGFKQLLVDRGVPADKIRVIYNWTDEAMFFPHGRDETLARELGLDGHFNIVYAGNLGPFQGLSTVVRAATRATTSSGVSLPSGSSRWCSSRSTVEKKSWRSICDPARYVRRDATDLRPRRRAPRALERPSILPLDDPEQDASGARVWPASADGRERGCGGHRP